MKACPYCAEEIQDAAIRCRWCQSDLLPARPAIGMTVPARGGGFDPSAGTSGLVPPQRPAGAAGSGMGVAALVLGLLGFLIPVILSVLAIVFGGIAISNSNSRGAPGKGMGIAGLVLGIVGVLVGLAVLSGQV